MLIFSVFSFLPFFRKFLLADFLSIYVCVYVCVIPVGTVVAGVEESREPLLVLLVDIQILTE